MTAIYNAADNTLTEQSDYDPPPDRPNIRYYSSSQQEMYQRHLDAWHIVMQGYSANKAQYEKTLRTIPAHDSARSLWKDGQKVEEGKEYRIQLSCSGNFEVCERQFRCSDCTPIAFPLPVKSDRIAHAGAGDIRESEDELWHKAISLIMAAHDKGLSKEDAVGVIKSQYIITKR